MSTTVLRQVAGRLLEYKIVLRVEFLGTKVRAHLPKGFTFDIYYNETTAKYSYTIFKEGRRILGWDNARHHIQVSTHPHHYHAINGRVLNSRMKGVPLLDLENISKELSL
ncbi:MAG: DUF6516 family protein [Candidatus Geothermarchaeales archaeon]